VKALVLDFDGVISDSAREAFVLALRTHCELDPRSRLCSVLARLDPGRPEAEPLYADFVEVMPLGNRAEDYAVALMALERGTEFVDQERYDAFKEAQGSERLRAFHKRFYELRKAWSRQDREGWLRLMAPYRPFVELLLRRKGQVGLAIATSKDRRSVRELLTHYGIEPLFPEGRVLDKETGVSKRAHLEHLQGVFAIPPGQLTFVDDKVNHLEAVAGLGVRCVLAAWGYNGAREQRRARALGFLVCQLDDVERQLFG
jgi:phosphoglycolate phosphatase-like HAD superfamily hydrolase